MTDIFAGLSRGVPGKSPREMRPPASGFEAAENIAAAKSLRFSPEKLFLGVIGATVETGPDKFAQGGHEIGVADDRHMITIAGSRAGKGRSAVIPNMLRYAGSVLAIDPKGELATITAKARSNLGQKVCVLDPFSTTGSEFRTAFNPLAHIRSPVEDAVLIADALIVSDEKDPHWTESARTFLEGVIIDVATSPRFEGNRDLVVVRDLIAEGDIFEGDDGEIERGLHALEGYMRMSDVPAVRRAAADFFERPDRERDSVLSTARRHLRALSFPEIEEVLRGDSFDLAELKSGRMTVFLCLPGRHMGTCGRWLRLFVNLALQAMEKTPGPPAAGCPVLFVLDEFASLGHMRQIEDAAGQIAGYGVKLWPILQDLGQLKALYKDRWETFMGNAGVLQFFGNNDLTTLEWISKRLGSVTLQQRQVSEHEHTPDAQAAGAGFSPNESYSPQTVPILQPDEIALVFGRSDPLLRQLVIRAGYAPMILQRAYYDKHDALRALAA